MIKSLIKWLKRPRCSGSHNIVDHRGWRADFFGEMNCPICGPKFRVVLRKCSQTQPLQVEGEK